MSKNITDNKDDEDNILEELLESPYAKKERRISNISKLLKVGRRSTSFDDEDIDQQHLSPMTTNKRFFSVLELRNKGFTTTILLLIEKAVFSVSDLFTCHPEYRGNLSPVAQFVY